MKNRKKLNSVALASAALILFLVLFSSAAFAATEQGTSSAGTYAYVTNDGNNTVSIIDTATNTVTATVNVGDGPEGVAVNPVGTKVYVTNYFSNHVSVIDTSTNKVTAKIKVGYYSWGVAVSPNGKKVYVTNTDSNTVSVIDAATNTVTATIHMNSASGVAVNPRGTKVYITQLYRDAVSVIDSATNNVTTVVPVGNHTWGVAVSPDGKKAYVTNAGCFTVSVIDTSTDKVTATLKVGSYPTGVAVNPMGTRVYVANYWSNTTSVIDTSTNEVIATVPVGDHPVGVAVNPSGTKVYVTNRFSNTVSVIDTYTDKVTATLKVGSFPTGVAISPASKPGLPVANFSAKPTEGNAPLKVQFTDKSTNNPTSWKWSFGDGNTSTTKNPAHTYIKVGKYTVSLTIKNAAGSNTKTIKNYIVANELKAPIAAFSASPTSGKAPLKVQFTDKSTNNPTSWKWTFGDGTYSTSKNPSHKYSKAGKYTVSLTVKNAKGSNTKKISNYITVKK